MRKDRRRCGRAVALAGAALLAAARAAAQDGETQRVHIHGYLTQALAAADGLPVFGIPGGEATLDYRAAAVQLRLAASPRDEVVLQLSHRRLGESVLSGPEDGVELDWAFYQRFLGPVSLRVGRVPIPLGIYNEVRDVGTLLPFYRAPGTVYLEGFETLDGAVAEYERPLGEWRLQAGVVGGQASVEFPLNAPPEPRLLEGRLDGVGGAQLWLHTPLPGVRAGAGAWGWRGHLAYPGIDGEQGGWMWNAGAEAELERGYLRGEYQRARFGDLRFHMYYGQAGVLVGRGFSLNAQAEVSNQGADLPGFPGEVDYARDLALGVNFAPAAGLVLKLEGHRARGYFFDSYVDVAGPAGESSYGIASLSVSF